MVRTQEARTGVLWTPEHRATTAGSLLLVTLIAFENMGVGTAMPTMVAELRGGALYSWPFTAFLVASVAATVLSGRVCDRKGPVPSLFAGPAVFLAGLVVAGSAPTMPVLLAGRVLQGFGTGTVLVATSLLIALVFTDRERPVIYAANAAAWVLPAVVGPTIAGLLTERVGWRWVFLGLVPLVVVGVALLVPVVRRLEPHTAAVPGRVASVPAAAVAAAGIAGLTWAAQHPSGLALGYGAVALAALGVALRRLLPVGTFTARRGLPTVVVSRALLAGAFAAMEAFLPLTMASVHGASPALAGLPLTVSALTWTAGELVQARHLDWRRENLVRAGFGFLAVGLVLFAFTAHPACPTWVGFAAAAVGGAGMGLGFPSLSVLLMRRSPVAERGFSSSAMQLGDWVTQSLVIGYGGVLLGAVASTGAPGSAIAVLAATLAAVAVGGFALARRAAA